MLYSSFLTSCHVLHSVAVVIIIESVVLNIFCIISGWLGKRNSVLRLRTALRTDDRLRLMNEIINGIQVIKMYTWEKPFAMLVSLARR